MKRLEPLIFLLIGVLNLTPAIAQNYNARMTNFEQVSEYEIQFDIQIRNIRDNPETTGAWAYEGAQYQLDINTGMLNGGQFQGLNLTVDNTGSDLPTNQLLADGDFFYSNTNTAFATNAAPTATNDPVMLLNHNEWRTITRFIVELRNAAGDGFLNFGDVDPSFAFRLGDTNVFEVPYYMDGATARRGTGVDQPADAVTVDKVAADLIIDVPDRQLAGYVFTGTENWSTPANWNQALKAVQESYTQSPPGASNNAIIAGIATVADTRTVNELTIAEGGALNVAPEGRLKTGVLYNDNQVPDPDKLRSGDLLARWGFDESIDNPQVDPIEADEGNANNTGVDPAVFHANVNYRGRGSDPTSAEISSPSVGNYFYIKVNTEEYKDMQLEFETRMRDDAKESKSASLEYLLEASVNNIDWISTGFSFEHTRANANSYIKHTVSSIGSDFNNLETLYFRWRVIGFDNTGGDWDRWSIRQISLTGTLDIPSLLIESSTTNQGQLIHDGVGIEAVVEQYIPESDWVMPTKGDTKLLTPADWYWIASPVTGQNIEAWLDAALGEGNHNSTNVDLYRWDEPAAIWRNYHGDNFVHVNFERGHGYLYAAKDASATYIYDGVMHVGDLELTLTQQGANFEGWNLVGNSFASGLLVDATLWDSDFAELQPSFYVEPGGDKDNGNGGSYDVYKQDEVIPPMRAFFVLTNTDNASLIIDKGARTMYNGPTKQANENYISLLAQPVEGNTGQRAYVRIAPGTSEGYDHRYDATFRQGIAPRFYSVKQNHNLIVNAVPELHADLQIPFFFRKNNEGDNFRIALTDHFEGWNLYLHDLKLDITHELATDKPYVFSSQNADDPMRFLLLFSPADDDDETGIDEPEQLAAAWTYNNTLYIHTHHEHTQARLFDISGREVGYFDIRSQGEHQYQLNLRPGVYLLRMHTNNQVETQRVIIR